LPAIAAKVAQAQRSTERRAAGYIPRVLRLCWSTPLSPREIAEGQGTLSPTTVRRIEAACTALAKAELLEDAGAGRYRVNPEQISRLRQLAQAVTRRT
jgi:ABC-type phosphate/phosphonate transport system substrate-binding protein